MTVTELLVVLWQAGGTLVEARGRPFGKGILVRVVMPDPETAVWARAVIADAGLTVGGNVTAGDRVECQVVFTVPETAGQPGLPPPPRTLSE